MTKYLTRSEKITRLFYILIALVIFFTTSDLACGFAGQSIPAAICSIISALIIFIGYFKIKKNDAEETAVQLTKFIKSNFDKWQIILSILDVICSIIVVFTSIMAIGMIFRNIILFKVLFTPAKITTISNKFKTVTKPLLIFCFVWLFLRMKNRIKEYKMSNIKLSTAQKIFMIIAFVLGVAYTLVSTIWLPQIAIFDNLIAQLATSLSGTAGIIFGAFLKGKEMTAEEIKKRDEKLKAKEEIREKKLEEKAKVEQEKLDKERLAKAQALVEKRKKEAEENAKIAEEKAKIEAIAAQLEAEEKAKEAEVPAV